MARTKPLEEDEPLDFARGVLDQIIARHDPEEARQQGKNPPLLLLENLEGQKGGHARAKNLTVKKRQSIAKKAANTRWTKASTKKEEP